MLSSESFHSFFMFFYVALGKISLRRDHLNVRHWCFIVLHVHADLTLKKTAIAGSTNGTRNATSKGDMAGAAPVKEEDEDDDIDPRTLQQAVAQLAKFTSENVEDPGELLCH